MPRKPRACSVEGCDGKHVARGYCMRHYQQMRWHGKIKPLRKNKGWGKSGEGAERDLANYVMVSHCCKALTTEGAQHENGKQYCKTCSEPCLWSWQHKSGIKFA